MLGVLLFFVFFSLPEGFSYTRHSDRRLLIRDFIRAIILDIERIDARHYGALLK